VPRTTASWSEIGTGFWEAIKAIWRELTWKTFFKMGLDMLLEQLVPPIAFYRRSRASSPKTCQLCGMVYTARVNLLSDPLGFLHDIWTMLLHFVTDFVLALVRRIINMAMSLMFWGHRHPDRHRSLFRWRSGWNFWAPFWVLWQALESGRDRVARPVRRRAELPARELVSV